MRFPVIETLADFQREVRFGVTAESPSLEFKAMYPWKDADVATRQRNALELARDIAQFANTDGGTLLVGVSEKLLPNGRVVADGIVPVVEAAGFVQWLEQAVRNNLTPATFSHSAATISTSDGVVVAVNVPPHSDLVALWPQAERRGMEYLARNSHGKFWLNPEEVEARLMDQTRAVRLAAKRVFDEMGREHRPADIVPPIVFHTLEYLGSGEPLFGVERDTTARPLLSAVTDDYVAVAIYPSGYTLHIPYALLRGVWVTADRRPALSLGARIIREDREEGTQYYLDAI